MLLSFPRLASHTTVLRPCQSFAVDEDGRSRARRFSFGASADFSAEGAFDVVAFGLGEAAKFFEGVIEATPEDAACLEGVFVVLAKTEDVEGTSVFMADDFSVAD
jgi:hypothetical protein